MFNPIVIITIPSKLAEELGDKKGVLRKHTRTYQTTNQPTYRKKNKNNVTKRTKKNTGDESK